MIGFVFLHTLKVLAQNAKLKQFSNCFSVYVLIHVISSGYRSLFVFRSVFSAAAMEMQGPSRSGISWVGVAWIMISDIVGTGVLTFTGVANHLGWLLTLVFIVAFFLAVLVISMIMSKTRALLEATAELSSKAGDRPLQIGNMGEVAKLAFGVHIAGPVITCIVYFNVLMGSGSYFVVLGRSLQQAVYPQSLCITIATALACVILLAPVMSVRRLQDSVVICFGNMLLIVIVVVVSLVGIGYQEKPACATTFLIAPGLDGWPIMGQCTKILYAYAGQWMYFEIMESMQSPSDFPKLFRIVGPFLLGSYLAVALIGYHLGARADDLVASLHAGTTLRVVAIMLFLHVTIAYLIKSTVIVRHMHGVWSPETRDDRTSWSFLVHGSLGIGMLAICWTLANAVPFFSQFTGLIGGCLAGPINILIPISLYLAAFRKYRAAQAEHHKALSEDSCEEGSLQDYGAVQTSTRARHSASSYSSSAIPPGDLLELPLWEIAALTLIVFVTLLIMVVGVTDQVLEVQRMWNTYGRPMDCHAYVPKGPSVNCETPNGGQRSLV